MSWLERLGLVRKDQQEAIRLSDAECWRVQSTRDGATFFCALTHLIGSQTVLYLEDATEKHFRAFLRSRQVSDPIPVSVGTIWPVSNRYHVAATADHLNALADLVDTHGIAIPAMHVHLYEERSVLVEWYDAFVDDPMYISSATSEHKVRLFAEAVGSRYEWAKHAT